MVDRTVVRQINQVVRVGLERGPRGQQGERGPKGDTGNPGKDAPEVSNDVPDFTLIFDNRLI